MTMANDYPTASDELPPNAIAVIGMAGRFPGADSVTTFWDNLRRGEESIATLSEEALTAAGVSAKTLADPAYVRRAPLLDGIEEFDAEYFGMTPYTARMMDPQQRLFLQTAWHAFEDSGYDPATFDGAIGVFAASTASGYLMDNLMSHRNPKALVGEGITVEMFNLVLLNDKDYLATRVSHQFNLRGPSLSVQTACSSSLVAVHLACQSLLSGECEMVLAGAASIRVPHHVGYTYEPGAMVSASGHCRPFDVRSDGTIFGSGVAAVILKPLQAALDDGDRIHAVIRGSAINNDGSVKMTYAAPALAGQAEVIAEAHAVAGVDSSTIGFVETHGTGTPLGDPIEIEALRQAFEVSSLDRSGPCVLGSVKSNIGHLDAASGVTGLIKTILCLKNKAIPPTVHYTAPNPELHLENTPFVVQNTYTPWESDVPRRAGVSSFGVGGTNAHVIVEEAPQTFSAVAEAPSGPQVLLLSARTAESLQDARAALATELSGLSRDEHLLLPDVAFTLAGRRAYEVRMAAVVADRADAAAVLTAAEHDNVSVGLCPKGISPGANRVAFLFPGQGAQHVGMARGLYDTEPVFRENFDRCAGGFAEELGIDLKAEVFDTGGQERSDRGSGTAGLEPTDLAQPALFAVEYALAQLVMSFCVTPAALAGHSIGELVAATLAGVFDLEAAIKVVSIRARLMHAAPAGSMVAVASNPDDIAVHMTADVDLAAINEFGNCVVAGPEEAIRAFTDRLAAQGILARRVRTSHAFHSQSMDPVLTPFAEFLSTVTLHAPRIPMLSNVTGTWMTDEEATDPNRWAQHIRSTVRFADELQELLGDRHLVLVEVGPGGSLTGSAVRLPGWSDTHRAVRLMRHPLQSRNDLDAVLLGLGQLWSAGVDVDWTALQGDQVHRVTLPGYAFARQRHWIEPAAFVRSADVSAPIGTVVAEPQPTDRKAGSATDARSQMQATLQRIWSQCLGVESIAPGDNFFELGGDSLLAIGVAQVLEILLDLAKPDDRAGHQLGEERHVGRELEEVPGRPDHAPVAVHDVGDRVERVERNSDREHDVPGGDLHAGAERLAHPAHRIHHEAPVLEEPQEREIDRDRDDQAELPMAGVRPAEKAEARGVAHQRGGGHEEAEPGVPVAVEDVAGHREPDVPGLGRSKQPEDRVRDREEYAEEDEAVEQHAQAPRLAHPPRPGDLPAFAANWSKRPDARSGTFDRCEPSGQNRIGKRDDSLGAKQLLAGRFPFSGKR